VLGRIDIVLGREFPKDLPGRKGVGGGIESRNTGERAGTD